MKESILMYLDTINDAVCESEIATAEALLAEYDKALTILEYSEIEPEQFGIFQEGKIMDDVKKQGAGQSKVMKIITFIPRLIAALFKAITGKLQTAAKSAKNVVEHTKGKDHNKMEEFIKSIKNGENKTAKKWLVALGVNAAIAGGFGLAKAHKYRDSKKPIQLQYSHLIKNGLSEADAKKFNECDKIMMDIYLSIHDDHDKITKPVSGETKEKFKKAYDTSLDLFKKISIHKCMKVMRVGNIKFTQKELSDHLNRMADCLIEMSQLPKNESDKNLQNTSDESVKNSQDKLDNGIENTKNEINEIVKENEKELEKVDDKSEVTEENSPTDENDESYHVADDEMDKAINDIMKQYSDLQNSGDVKLIDFYYNSVYGLNVRYNKSIMWLCGELSMIGDDIMAHPDKLDKFTSFYNSYSDTVKKFANSRYKTMTAAIVACVTNNIGQGLINKDMLYTVEGTNDFSGDLTKYNDYDTNVFNRRYGDAKMDSNFNNNSEAVKALETIADIIKQVYSETLTYISAIVDIVTKLEAIFGYEKMYSHANEKS